MTSQWDTRWSKILAVVANWSEDTSSKYGAVIVDKRQCLVSTGFNGLPRGIKPDPAYHARPDKYNYFIHAEVNAILNAHIPVVGCTMYLLKTPCAPCAGAIINSGITGVKYLKHHSEKDLHGDLHGTWRMSIEDAQSMLSEASVKMIHVGE
jgi:dCMP deaminase